MRFITGLFIILLGLSFLFDFPFLKILLALLIIWLGIKVLSGDDKPIAEKIDTSVIREDSTRSVHVFSGFSRKLESEAFRGGEIVTVLGGGDLDLTGVKAGTKTVEISVVAVLGSIKVRIPKDWSVSSEGVGILGGFENETVPPAKRIIQLRIKGAAVLGGVTITN